MHRKELCLTVYRPQQSTSMAAPEEAGMGKDDVVSGPATVRSSVAKAGKRDIAVKRTEQQNMRKRKAAPSASITNFFTASKVSKA